MWIFNLTWSANALDENTLEYNIRYERDVWFWIDLVNSILFWISKCFFEIGIQDRILRNVVSQQKYQFPWWKFKENAMGQLVKINATVLFGWRSSPKRFSFSFPNWPPRLFTQVVNCASQIARKVVKLEIWEGEKTFCFLQWYSYDKELFWVGRQLMPRPRWAIINNIKGTFY